jgi:hypothetical protein
VRVFAAQRTRPKGVVIDREISGQCDQGNNEFESVEITAILKSLLETILSLLCKGSNNRSKESQETL